ncbi:MAG: ABC transporter ATP-binding protein [Chromatiales bacterium]|nr:ABC transporter ATP-binding protein [Chromatiales bacterium]
MSGPCARQSLQRIAVTEQDGWLVALEPPERTPVTEALVIQVDDLRKHYGPIRAVDGISFTVARGATCALLGGNGAGKTTTIAMLLGLLLPTSGRIRILGEDVPRHRHRVLPRMNFSSPYVDLPQRLTVAENLTVYARLYGVRRIRERLATLGRDLDIDGVSSSAPTAICPPARKPASALAKALLNEPEILLLDEPTASLDPDTADRMRGILTDYQQPRRRDHCCWPPTT